MGAPISVQFSFPSIRFKTSNATYAGADWLTCRMSNVEQLTHES